MIKVTEIDVLSAFRLQLRSSDGTVGLWDASRLLAKNGRMIEPLREPDYFARVFLEAGAPTWPNGFDLAPWALHKELTSNSMNV